MLKVLLPLSHNAKENIREQWLQQKLFWTDDNQEIPNPIIQAALFNGGKKITYLYKIRLIFSYEKNLFIQTLEVLSISFQGLKQEHELKFSPGLAQIGF